MTGTRLFVGNLSLKVKEKHLLKLFSQYGSVTSIEIKSKLDIDKNPVSQFAYIIIESSVKNIDDCLFNLNGLILKGSAIVVEPARESFLEKLKREREERNKVDDALGSHTNAAHNNWGRDFSSVSANRSSYERVPRYNRTDINENVHNMKTECNSYEQNDESDNFHHIENEYDDLREDGSGYGNYDQENYSENGNHIHNSQPKLHSTDTFRRYDPTAPENDQDSKQQVNKGERYNKTKNFAEISGDLHLQKTSFSLLEKFSKLEVKDLEPMPRPPKFNDMQRKTNIKQMKICDYKSNIDAKKTSNFFIRDNDACLEESVTWLLTPLTKKNREEFDMVRPELVELFRLRHTRAVRKANKGSETTEHSKVTKKRRTSKKKPFVNSSKLKYKNR